MTGNLFFFFFVDGDATVHSPPYDDDASVSVHTNTRQKGQ